MVIQGASDTFDYDKPTTRQWKQTDRVNPKGSVYILVARSIKISLAVSWTHP
jgi:hypothetical protein